MAPVAKAPDFFFPSPRGIADAPMLRMPRQPPQGKKEKSTVERLARHRRDIKRAPPRARPSEASAREIVALT